jgi:hypothetical protein
MDIQGYFIPHFFSSIKTIYFVNKITIPHTKHNVITFFFF